MPSDCCVPFLIDNHFFAFMLTFGGKKALCRRERPLFFSSHDTVKKLNFLQAQPWSVDMHTEVYVWIFCLQAHKVPYLFNRDKDNEIGVGILPLSFS